MRDRCAGCEHRIGRAAAPDDTVEVPASVFTMGRDGGPADERPAHRVSLPAFRIDRFPVTNARFAEFLDAAGTHNARGADGREDPAVGPVRGTRGGGHDSPADELTTTQRGRNLSRSPASGHHNIGFRCAKSNDQ